MPTIVSAWLSDELAHALDTFAAAQRVSRSALIRGVLEDAIDTGQLPTVSRPPTTTAELLEQLRDDELERLREITLG